MKDWIYNCFVNKVPGIRERYIEKKHKCKNYLLPILYAFWLNIRYYIFFDKNLKFSNRFFPYERKKLYCKDSESSLSKLKSPEFFAKYLSSYDVISFDIFDTLIFRCLSDPKDLFYFLGAEFNYIDFKKIRTESEEKARKIKYKNSNTGEIKLEEIWEVVEYETGIPKKYGIEKELEFEKKFCFANPYMIKVTKKLLELKKKIVITSDTYLDEKYIKMLLKKCGYDEFYEYFISCEYGKSKADGSLYDKMKEKMGYSLSYIHIGDNKISDTKMAVSHGIKSIHYKNVNEVGKNYRAYDMSCMTGSFYRGLVNSHIHNGLHRYSREYEYGYIYGGLFVLGYCRFINKYAKFEKIDKMLFLSRDGYILLKAYNIMHPESMVNTKYVYWSRLSAVKLSANYYRHEYIKRFLYFKADKGYSIEQILKSMEIEWILEDLCEKTNLKRCEKFTFKNLEVIKRYILDSWNKILKSYESQVNAAKKYYEKILCNCKKALVVDIGWLGSGAIMLNYMVKNVWNINCDLRGIVAGTDTYFSREANASEPIFFSDFLLSYLYSQQKNRDIWKFHNPLKNHNLYWELILGAPQESFKGFYFNDKGDVELKFKKNKVNIDKINEIHKGIIDFIETFLKFEKQIDFNFNVEGRDAYAPMILAEIKENKKFMKYLEELMDDIQIG